MPAAQAVLQPGEAAPLFSRTAADGRAFNLDRKTNAVVMLVFVKPADRFTSDALHALERMFDQFPPLLEGMRVGVIVSRLDGEAQLKTFQKRVAPRWPVIADSGDQLYKSYRIVATPTVVIVGPDRAVAAIHPGFDPGMPDTVRTALSRVRKIPLPEAMTGKVAKPNMTLQMARRLAARGLWEDALKYYGDAAKLGPLPPEVPLELAAIHLEMNDPDAALALLGTLPDALKQDDRAKTLAARAQTLKSGRTDKPQTAGREPIEKFANR